MATPQSLYLFIHPWLVGRSRCRDHGAQSLGDTDVPLGHRLRKGVARSQGGSTCHCLRKLRSVNCTNLHSVEQYSILFIFSF